MHSNTNTPAFSVSSLTYALRGQRLLERYGYTAWASRDHNPSRRGCGYQLTVKGDARQARQLLLEHGIRLASSEASEGGGEQ